MAFPAIAGTIANVNSSAVLGIYVMDTTSNKWQTIGAIADARVDISEFVANDQLGRNRSNKAYSIMASCKMLQAGLVAHELLDSLVGGTNSWLFKMADAEAVTASAAYGGWVYFTAAQVNVKPKIVASGTPEDTRAIELEWNGAIAKTDANEIAMLTPTLAATSFASTADSGTAVFYGLGVYTATTDGGSPAVAQILSCGATAKLDIAGGAGVTIAPVTNINLTIEPLSSPDSTLRPITKGWGIALELDQMSTLKADTLLVGNATSDSAKAIITMIDGMVYTFDDCVGIQCRYLAEGDVEGTRVFRWTLNGKILKSSLDGVVS